MRSGGEDPLQRLGHLGDEEDGLGVAQRLVVAEHPLRHVGERQVGDADGAHVELEHTSRALQHPAHVAVGEGHALGRPGGPRGVDDRGGVTGTDLRPARVEGAGVGGACGAAALDELRPGQHPVEMHEVLRLLEQHHVLERRKVPANVVPARQHLAVLQDGDLRAAVRRDVLDLLR